MKMEYRHLLCCNCDQKLRIGISKQHFGKTVLVTCPKCAAQMRVAIPVPASQAAKIRNDADKDPAPFEFLKDIFKIRS